MIPPSSQPTPRIVLVTGEPGSGKTTLGTDLARVLRVPFLARDDVRGGLFLTAGSWSERPLAVPSRERAVEVFLQLAETAARLGVSSVVEYVVGRSRPQDLERLTAVAQCVVVQAWCTDAPSRFEARHRADRLLGRQPVLDALGFGSIDEHTDAAVERMRHVAADMRTDFDLPVLRVRTDDGYEPDLDAIVAFVTADARTAG